MTVAEPSSPSKQVAPREDTKKLEQSEIWAAMRQGTKDAEADVNRLEWFAAGLLLNAVGLLAAYVSGTDPPSSRLLGKHPDYVRAYTSAYSEKTKSLKTRGAFVGFTVSSVACVTIGGCLLVREILEETLNCLHGLGYGSQPNPE